MTTPKTKPYFSIEFDKEKDGRWIAEIPKLPGVMAYGTTKKEATQKVYAVALRTLADSLEERNSIPVWAASMFGHYEMVRH